MIDNHGSKTAGLLPKEPSSGHSGKLGEPISATASAPGRGKQGSTLRNCVYYQNRFIILDSLDDKSQLSSSNNEDIAKTSGRLPWTTYGRLDDRNNTGISTTKHSETRSPRNDNDEEDGRHLSFDSFVTANNIPAGVNYLADTSTMEMDASSVTMVPRGIEVIVEDGEGGSPRRMTTRPPFPPRQTSSQKKENELWKKITTLLQDNRMKGRDDCKEILNSTRPEDHKTLKKSLNIIFLTVGISLLLSVIIVVIYSIVQEMTQGPYIPAGSNDLPPEELGEDELYH